MKPHYPQDMTYTQWRRTPFRIRHRLIGVMLNDHLRHWRTCRDARCRRARSCQDYECYWRRLREIPFEQSLEVRAAVKPLAQLLWIGCNKGSQGKPLY